MFKIHGLLVFFSTLLIGQYVLAEPTKQTIEVTASGFKFLPHSWTIIAGQETTLRITNQTVQEHEWVLLKHGTRVTIPFSDDDEDKVYWEIEARAGETKEAMFIAPLEPGTYNIVCGKPRHIERGMTATLIVK